MILGKKKHLINFKLVWKYFCNFSNTIKEQSVGSFIQLTSIMILPVCLVMAVHILVPSQATSLRKY